MHPYYDHFQDLLRRLSSNKSIDLLQHDFNRPLQTSQNIVDMAHFIEKEYGFVFPEEEWVLGCMPSTVDIAWLIRPEAQLALSVEELGGCISLVNFTESFDNWEYHLDKTNPNFPAFAHCSYLETGGAEDFDYRTFLHFVPGQGQAPDVRLFDRPDVLPLTTSLGEYVRAALAWHGAYGWQFLYLPLEQFKALPLVTRQKAYVLAKVLPDLFPDADWSVIETKRAFFDTEHN